MRYPQSKSRANSCRSCGSHSVNTLVTSVSEARESCVGERRASQAQAASLSQALRLIPQTTIRPLTALAPPTGQPQAAKCPVLTLYNLCWKDVSEFQYCPSDTWTLISLCLNFTTRMVVFSDYHSFKACNILNCWIDPSWNILLIFVLSPIGNSR